MEGAEREGAVISYSMNKLEGCFYGVMFVSGGIAALLSWRSKVDSLSRIFVSMLHGK
jgi:hypothetical protein